MNITTKYELGQFLNPICSFSKPEFVTCPVCKGTGQIKLKGTQYLCPKCHGNKGSTTYGPQQWNLADRGGFVGKVIIEVHDDEYRYDGTRDRDETKYMLSSTGVGSGTLWQEANLFPSKAEAQAECDRRNAEAKT